jgi:hypothetical protein
MGDTMGGLDDGMCGWSVSWPKVETRHARLVVHHDIEVVWDWEHGPFYCVRRFIGSVEVVGVHGFTGN